MMNPFRALLEKPWQAHPDPDGGFSELDFTPAAPPQKVALIFFLGVVTVLFGLLIAAYFIRMELDDWRPVQTSSLLWINTFILFLSSFTLQWTHNVLRKGQVNKVKQGLILGAVLTAAFIYGQVLVWQQLAAEGHYLYNNPANSFFYLLTGGHIVHLLGGLWVWTKASIKVWSGDELEEIGLSVELCALYWHFLLLVWLVLFALISYT